MPDASLKLRVFLKQLCAALTPLAPVQEVMRLAEQVPRNRLVADSCRDNGGLEFVADRFHDAPGVPPEQSFLCVPLFVPRLRDRRKEASLGFMQRLQDMGQAAEGHPVPGGAETQPRLLGPALQPAF